jgi:AraC-like DNA-binding protein
LCEKFHISKTTLYNISLKSFGISIIQYIEKLQITKAKELLLETESTISEIAYKCGFIDGNYFSKRFKQITGVSPSEFRNANH